MVCPNHLVLRAMVTEILHSQWRGVWIWRAGWFKGFRFQKLFWEKLLIKSKNILHLTFGFLYGALNWWLIKSFGWIWPLHDLQEVQDGHQLPLAHDGGPEQHCNDFFQNFFSWSDDSWSRDTLVTIFRFSYHFQTYGDHMSSPLKFISRFWHVPFWEPSRSHASVHVRSTWH